MEVLSVLQLFELFSWSFLLVYVVYCFTQRQQQVNFSIKKAIHICYAQPTKNKQGIVTGVKGGTKTAVQLAMKHNIPIYNFYLQKDIDKVKGMMEKYKV